LQEILAADEKCSYDKLGSHHVVSDGLLHVTIIQNGAARRDSTATTIRILKLLLWHSVPFLNIGFHCLMLLHRSDADHREEGKATSLIMFCFFAASPFLDVS
jgi:hypothetical protein